MLSPTYPPPRHPPRLQEGSAAVPTLLPELRFHGNGRSLGRTRLELVLEGGGLGFGFLRHRPGVFGFGLLGVVLLHGRVGADAEAGLDRGVYPGGEVLGVVEHEAALHQGGLVHELRRLLRALVLKSRRPQARGGVSEGRYGADEGAIFRIGRSVTLGSLATLSRSSLMMGCLGLISSTLLPFM